MARLPIYTNEANIRVAEPIKIRGDQGWQMAEQVARQGQELAVRWQETQNAAESLDGKNRMIAAANDVLDEAENFTDYKTPADLKRKEDEFLSRLDGILPEVTGGFTNDVNAARFSAEYQLTMAQNSEKLKSIFREKYIDNNAANLTLSHNNNFNSYIQTGNVAYKQSYLSDLDNSFKAGYISETEKVKLSSEVDGWDMEYIKNMGAQDPDAALETLKKNYPDYAATKSGRDTFNFITAEKNRQLEQAQKSSVADFIANPTTEGLERIKKLNPLMSTSKLDRLSEILEESPNYEASTTFDSNIDALTGLNTVLAMPTETAAQKADFLQKSLEYHNKLMHSNTNGTLSYDDKQEYTNTLAEAMSNDDFKAKIQELPDMNIFSEIGRMMYPLGEGRGTIDYPWEQIKARNDISKAAYDTSMKMLQLAKNGGTAEQIREVYTQGMEYAVKRKYWWVPELQNQKLEKGKTIIRLNGTPYVFNGFFEDDILVERDEK